MARDTIICGLDIGSSAIRTVIAHKKRGSEQLSLVGVGEVPSVGVRKGVIVDSDEAAAAIKESIKAAEHAAGHAVRSVYVSVSGAHVSSRYSKGIVSVSRADEEISEDDVARVVAQAQSIAMPPNKEILHVLPKEYIVDGESGIQDPVGMHGKRLETNVVIIECSAPVIRNLVKCVEAVDVEIDGFVASPVAAAQAVLSKRQKELGVLLLDIGGTTSGIAAFEEGSMIHAAVLPVGAAHITNDIAIGLQVDIDVAEMIKVRYGVCRPDAINRKEMIHITAEESGEKIDNISRKEVAEIIEARMDELFDLVEKELKKITKQVLFPGGVVIVGGGAQMNGMVEFAKQRLKLPAHVGVPDRVDGVVDQLASPQYATAVGLCLLTETSLVPPVITGQGVWDQSMRAMKKALRMFLP